MHTLKVDEEASTFTATGPTVATAHFRSDSLPLFILTIPETPAVDLLSSKKHCPCYRQINSIHYVVAKETAGNIKWMTILLVKSLVHRPVLIIIRPNA
jgi:hypothetical protein